MQEMADWLKALGLPDYARAFAENGIDVSVLPHLTDQDVRDVVVLLDAKNGVMCRASHFPSALDGGSVW